VDYSIHVYDYNGFQAYRQKFSMVLAYTVKQQNITQCLIIALGPGQLQRAHWRHPLKESSFCAILLQRTNYSSFSQPSEWQGWPLFIFLSFATEVLLVGVHASIYLDDNNEFCRYPLEDVEARVHKSNYQNKRGLV